LSSILVGRIWGIGYNVYDKLSSDEGAILFYLLLYAARTRCAFYIL